MLLAPPWTVYDSKLPLVVAGYRDWQRGRKNPYHMPFATDLTLCIEPGCLLLCQLLMGPGDCYCYWPKGRVEGALELLARRGFRVH